MIAGPDRPPVMFPNRGWNVSTSTDKPTIVLIKDKASAPPSCAAFAKTVISVTLGESLTITGHFDSCLMTLIKSYVAEGFSP